MGLNRRYIHFTIILTAYVFLLLAVRWTFLLKVVKPPGAKLTEHLHPIRVQRHADERILYEPRTVQPSVQPSPRDQISAPPLEPMVWPEVKTIKRKRSTRRRVLNTLRAVFTNFMHP